MEKSYRQFCGVAKALDVLGERWTLLIVRDLILGPRRFSDIAHSLVGITPNLLSKRLLHLTEQGLIETGPVSGLRSARAYRLTDAGKDLEPVVLSLGAFGARYLEAPAQDERLDPRYAMLSLKRRYIGSKFCGAVALQMGTQFFSVRFGGPSIDVRDGDPIAFDVRLSGPASVWFTLLSRRATLSELESQGGLVRSGSVRLARAFLRSVGARP